MNLKRWLADCQMYLSYPDIVSTKQAWTLWKSSFFALVNISPTWTSAPSCLHWFLSSSTSVRMKQNVSTACPDWSASLTQTSVTLTRPSSPTAPPVWPLETSPTGAAEASVSWSPAHTRTSLSFTRTGSCGYLQTCRSPMPSECWMCTYWKAIRSYTGLFLLQCHTGSFCDCTYTTTTHLQGGARFARPLQSVCVLPSGRCGGLQDRYEEVCGEYCSPLHSWEAFRRGFHDPYGYTDGAQPPVQCQ